MGSDKGNVEMVTPVWFDRWVKQANRRNSRERFVAAVLGRIASIMLALGLLMVVIGTAWIDSMDICKANVMMAFIGVGLSACGARIKWLLGE